MPLLLAICLTLTQHPTPNPVQQASQLIGQGQYQQAIDLLEPVVQAQPQSPGAWSLLGYCYHAQKDWERAIPAHEKAATFPQTAANASYNLACAWSLQGDSEKAFAWLAKAKTAGFQNWSSLWQDPDLVSLQSDPRFLNFAPPKANFENPFVEKTKVLFAWHGENANDQFGWVATDAGDIDGDGVHDVITSAPFWKDPSAPQQPAGRVYLYSGKTGQEIRRHSGNPFDQLGLAVAGVGDLNQDGFADYAATAPRQNDPKRPGSVLVWSGQDGSLLVEPKGAKSQDGFGRHVEGTIDWNGDGTLDFLVGSPKASGGQGLVTIHSGKDGSVLQEMRGESAGDHFGSTVSAGGFPPNQLLVVGAMNAGKGQRGRVYVYQYADNKQGFQKHFRVESEANNVNFGRFFSSVIGDLNADGTPDVYVVDFEANTSGKSSGQVRVFSGADGQELWRRDGLAGEGLGIGNAIAGDANHDGHADVVTGAWTNGAAAASAGRCYLLSGKDGRVLRMWTCNLAGATMGFDSTTLPDCNGDEQRDYLFTAAWTAVQGPKTGSVYLLSSPFSVPTRD